MNAQHASYHPEHDRISCSDSSPVNAQASGSNGCARCTALALDERAELLAVLNTALDDIEHLFRAAKEAGWTQLHNEEATVRRGRALIVKAARAQE